MKKFQFGLDTVLDYKTQILESLQAEHGAILAQVRKQEEVLRRLEHRYGQTNEAFCEKKKTGLSVADALAFETGLRALEKDIHREGEKLAQLRRRGILRTRRGQVELLDLPALAQCCSEETHP